MERSSMNNRAVHDAAMAAQRFADAALCHLDKGRPEALSEALQALRDALDALDDPA